MYKIFFIQFKKIEKIVCARIKKKLNSILEEMRVLMHIKECTRREDKKICET